MAIKKKVFQKILAPNIVRANNLFITKHKTNFPENE